MLKLEILLALFATMLNVQADPFRIDDRHPVAAENARDTYQDWKQGAIAPKVAAHKAVDTRRDVRKEVISNNRPVVTVTANTVAVVTASAIAPGIVNNNYPRAHAHARAHHARHEVREEVAEEAYPVARAAEACPVVREHHPRAHAAACHVAHKPHPKVRAAAACHVAHKPHPKVRAAAACHVAHKPLPKVRAAAAACDVPREKVEALEHIKETHPLAAHVPVARKIADVIPGAGRADHDSNDFQSFEVAQLDILRVTKLDSEHAHNAHAEVIDPEVKRAVIRRSEDLRDGVRAAPVARHEAREELAEAKVRKEAVEHRHPVRAAHRSRKLHREARQARRRADILTDSDDDVRVARAVRRDIVDIDHPRAARAVRRDILDVDIDHPRAARAVRRDIVDIDHPRAARAARRDIVDVDIDRPRRAARVARRNVVDIDHPRAARAARRDIVDVDIDRPRRAARVARRNVVDIDHPRAARAVRRDIVDVDIDHPRAARAVRRDIVDVDIDHPRARAAAHRDLDVHVHRKVDFDHPRVPAPAQVDIDINRHAPARVAVKSDDLADKTKENVSNVGSNVMDAIKGTGKGVGDIFSGIGKKLTGKNDVKVDDAKKAETKADVKKAETKADVKKAEVKGDLSLSAVDRARLEIDLKAINELDREALQYLDTSCGPVKSLEKKKKAKHLAEKVKKHVQEKNKTN